MGWAKRIHVIINDDNHGNGAEDSNQTGHCIGGGCIGTERDERNDEEAAEINDKQNESITAVRRG